MKNLLLWEKWRPKTIEDLILLPRIKKHFQDGYLNQNYVFYGNAGTGKTTLARILIGKYTKDKAYLEINSSLYTSIDILRNDIFNQTEIGLMGKAEMKIPVQNWAIKFNGQFQHGLNDLSDEPILNIQTRRYAIGLGAGVSYTF